ncbi:MAG: hypothetical protein MJE77_47230 [Proteobacteria bacterium]|nr:hypothetical protein [Pseudomonadota bacterium]
MTAVIVVISLMVVGLCLLAIEILVVPGIGVIGVLGALSILGSGYAAVTELPPAYAGLTVAAGVVAAVALFWLFPRTRAARAMVLQTRTLGSAADPSLNDLVGLEGITLTPLRPAGTAEIVDKPVDVVSDGQYVETGIKVRVVLVEGNRVVVEPVS